VGFALEFVDSYVEETLESFVSLLTDCMEISKRYSKINGRDKQSDDTTPLY
jgi:hypothetical protein